MNKKNNPLTSGKRVGKFETIPFPDFKFEHYEPAFDIALKEANDEIDEIRKDESEPTFENTIEALDSAGELLEYVSTVYYNMVGAESNDEFKDLAQKVSPKLSAFSNSIMMDPVLFKKVKAIFDNKENLNFSKEQLRLLEKSYKGFTRNGALLPDKEKEKLRMIDEEMSKLAPKFSKNVLGATNAFEYVTKDESELEGLPQGAKDSAAFMAKQKKKAGWLFNLQAPSAMPVLKYAKNRELREKIYRKFTSRAFNDNFDNQEILKRIAVLRNQRANLLGFETHAQYTLAERMAEKPNTVMSFLDRIFEASLPKAKEELEEVKALAKEIDGLEDFKAWDASYYSEKLRKKKYEFDAEELRPYFKADNVIAGIFKVANKMYDLNFKQIYDIPLYHKDVTTYEVTGSKGEHIGLLYIDLFPRETKRGGAWMTEFRTQGMVKGEMKRPHVAVVCNLSPATDKTPALLQFTEARTLFHEFGHALHGLLSDCHYKTLASPNVYWDFVELPSQVMENWLMEEEALELFATHYKTGKVIPKDLIQK
ncbi:MAG: M3 family metallopeptidase, partial [Candidatus Cloacimonadota bacterium]|nr:M3 family metallopeptidase [Candidatus Cloacimonadota bacterium]